MQFMLSTWRIWRHRRVWRDRTAGHHERAGRGALGRPAAEIEYRNRTARS